MSGALLVPAIAQTGGTDPATGGTAGTNMNRTAGDRDDSFNMGWLGLVGLAGLLGMRRRHDNARNAR